MLKIVNLTPHAIRLVRSDGTEVTYGPAPPAARVKMEKIEVGMVDGAPVHKTIPGPVEGLPEPRSDFENCVFFIVSFPVLQALGGSRQDVIAPDTSPGSVIRDDAGNITGVRGWQQI